MQTNQEVKKYIYIDTRQKVDWNRGKNRKASMVKHKTTCIYRSIDIKQPKEVKWVRVCFWLQTPLWIFVLFYNTFEFSKSNIVFWSIVMMYRNIFLKFPIQMSFINSKYLLLSNKWSRLVLNYLIISMRCVFDGVIIKFELAMHVSGCNVLKIDVVTIDKTLFNLFRTRSFTCFIFLHRNGLNTWMYIFVQGCWTYLQNSNVAKFRTTPCQCALEMQPSIWLTSKLWWTCGWISHLIHPSLFTPIIWLSSISHIAFHSLSARAPFAFSIFFFASLCINFTVAVIVSIVIFPIIRWQIGIEKNVTLDHNAPLSHTGFMWMWNIAEEKKANKFQTL